jgi:hypothetical protein
MAGDRSREMRRLASEWLALARQASDPLARNSRLDMALKWIDLAELSEHDPWNDALRRRAIQAAIGQGLRQHSKSSSQCLWTSVLMSCRKHRRKKDLPAWSCKRTQRGR